MEYPVILEERLPGFCLRIVGIKHTPIILFDFGLWRKV